LPQLDEIIAERRQRLAAAVEFATEQLRALIPEAEFSAPDGGSVLWVRFPVDDSEPLVLGRQPGPSGWASS
jgi:DNA-binding transcriptional MocR family regulator